MLESMIQTLNIHNRENWLDPFAIVFEAVDDDLVCEQRCLAGAYPLEGFVTAVP